MQRVTHVFVLCVVLICWLIPTSSEIDVGSFDAPWVSDAYNVQWDRDITYRWTYPQGNIHLFALGGGTYRLTSTMRAPQNGVVTITVDHVLVDEWHVTDTWATYTSTVSLATPASSDVVVAIACPQAHYDGKRSVCVAMDRLQWHAVGWVWPPVWPVLLSMLVLGILLWLNPPDWVIWACAGIVASGIVLNREVVSVLAPYGVIATVVAAVSVVAARRPHHRGWQFAQLSAIMLGVATLRYALYGSVGLMLEDEGQLWYNSQQLLAGKLPFVDYQGYDVPRYIINAMVMLVTGDTEIRALRLALALCEWIALICFGMYSRLVGITPRMRVFWFILIVVVCWLAPRHKMYDHIVLWALLVAVELFVQHHTIRRAWLLGVVIGLIACVGRNHGLYGVCASLLVVGYTGLRTSWSQAANYLLWLCIGIVVGFLPQFIMFLVNTPYAYGYIEELVTIVTWRGTNPPLPFPVLWDAHTAQLLPENIWYFYPIMMYVIGICVIVKKWQRTHAPVGLISALCVGIPYIHVWVQRADYAHLAQSIAPAIMLSAVLLLTVSQWKRDIAAVVACVCVIWTLYDGIWPASWIARHKTQQEITVGSSQLTVNNEIAARLKTLAYVQATYNAKNEGFMVAPFWPGAYAIYQHTSPVFYHSVVFHYPDDVQTREIARMQDAQPRYILINDQFLDGDKQRQFRLFMPELDRYITTHYRRVDDVNIPDSLRLYVP